MTRGQRRLPLALTLLLLLSAPVLAAGCLTGAAEEGDPLARAAVKPSGAYGPVPDPDANLSGAQRRWHFHDAWDEAHTLLLMDAPVVLPLQVDRVSAAPAMARSGRAVFTFPHGAIVPPETGVLRVGVAFEPAPGVPFTGLLLSYRAPNAQNYTSLGPVTPGEAVAIPVDWWTADVPHAKVSGWSFLLEAAPDARGVAVANGTARVTVEAERQRAVMIDPPHGDPWVRAPIRILLPETHANVSGVKLADGRYLVRSTDAVEARPALLEVHPPNGSLVPEATESVLVRVTWEGAAPVDLQVRYEEPNSPSGGLMMLVKEDARSRVFAVEISPKMADSPYAYTSTWTFSLETADAPGSPNPDTVTVTAWASRGAVDEAIDWLPTP